MGVDVSKVVYERWKTKTRESCAQCQVTLVSPASNLFRAGCNFLFSYNNKDLCPAVLTCLRVLSVDCCDSSTTYGNFYAMEHIRLTDLRAIAAHILSSS